MPNSCSKFQVLYLEAVELKYLACVNWGIDCHVMLVSHWHHSVGFKEVTPKLASVRIFLSAGIWGCFSNQVKGY